MRWIPVVFKFGVLCTCIRTLLAQLAKNKTVNITQVSCKIVPLLNISLIKAPFFDYSPPLGNNF
jgi:hypothetical protein